MIGMYKQQRDPIRQKSISDGIGENDIITYS